jgi:hypothetical protein
MMAKKDKEFVQTTYSTPTVIHLTRKQIKQMSDMAEHFKDIDDFELHISHESGIGQSMNLRFTLNLAGEDSVVKADVTDVSKW